MSEVASPVTKVLEEDTPCRRCGYNLRGLLPTGLCPECGTAVSYSIVGNLLKQADPGWLKRLHMGALVKICSIILSTLQALAFAVDSTLGIAGALSLLANLLITSPEPPIVLNGRRITIRNALRMCAVMVFVGDALLISILSFTLSIHFNAASWNAIRVKGGMLIGLIGMFIAWGEMLYFRRLAHRIPDANLLKSTTSFVRLGPLGVFVVGLATFIVGTRAPRDPLGFGPGLFVFFLVGVGLISLSAWYLLLLIKYLKAFRQAVAESRASVMPQPNV